MAYNFSEKEKRFILDCIREDDLLEAEEYMISLNGEIDKINDYYLDLLFKAQSYILEENDKNIADFNLLTLYSENLQNIYLDISKLPKEDMGAALGNVYAGKRPIAELTSKYDLIINLADVGASVDQRLQWPPSKGTPDIPFYVNEIPTIFVSVQCPFHLADVPQVKTYINTYDSKDYTLKALVDKMMGRSEFKGVSPVDAFCGLEDTKY